MQKYVKFSYFTTKMRYVPHFVIQQNFHPLKHCQKRKRGDIYFCLRFYNGAATARLFRRSFNLLCRNSFKFQHVMIIGSPEFRGTQNSNLILIKNMESAYSIFKTICMTFLHTSYIYQEIDNLVRVSSVPFFCLDHFLKRQLKASF